VRIVGGRGLKKNAENTPQPRAFADLPKESSTRGKKSPQADDQVNEKMEISSKGEEIGGSPIRFKANRWG